MRRPGWLASLFILATALPPLKKPLWRWWYNLVARHDTEAELLFMNYGYADEQDETFVLQPVDAAWRYPIQLYRHVLAGIDLDEIDVLEVGSGRGGGASWLARYHQPYSVLGVDLSAEAIAFCNSHLNLSGLSFRQGAADALPVANSSVDVVLNVESSHCYPDMPAFIAETHRVLRPAGYFVFCDLRSVNGAEKLMRDFQGSGLELLQSQDITENVLRALDRMSKSRQSVIMQRVPRWLRSTFSDFVALQDTVLYDKMRSGDVVYMSCRLQKQARPG